jgi:hypothetical protein
MFHGHTEDLRVRIGATNNALFTIEFPAIIKGGEAFLKVILQATP